MNSFACPQAGMAFKVFVETVSGLLCVLFQCCATYTGQTHTYVLSFIDAGDDLSPRV